MVRGTPSPFSLTGVLASQLMGGLNLDGGDGLPGNLWDPEGLTWVSHCVTGGLPRGGGAGLVTGVLGLSCEMGVAGWDRKEENVGCSFKISSSGAKLRFRTERSPGAGTGGTGGAGRTGAREDVEPPTELVRDPPWPHKPPRV